MKTMLTAKPKLKKQNVKVQPTKSTTTTITATATTKSKAGKKQKNLYLSDQARQLLATFSLQMGISETAVVELLIREKAGKENVILPLDNAAK